jgi:hypothetical protein
MIQVNASSNALRHFEKNGEPGPAFTFDFTVDGRLLNMYPVLAAALLIALPGQRLRRIAAALLLALVLSLCAAMLDLYIQCQWQHARVLEDLLPSFDLPSTALNEQAYARLLRGLDRLQRFKAFLAAGGRQFFAVLTALLAGTACLRPRALASDNARHDTLEPTRAPRRRHQP